MQIFDDERVRRNDIALVAIALFLFWVPIPLGSNRAFFWYLNGAIIAVGTLLYMFRSPARSVRLLPMRAFWLPGLPFALAWGWMVVQVLPLGYEPPDTAVWALSASALGQDIVARISVDPAATYAMLVRWASYALFFFIVAQATVNRLRGRRLVILIFWVIAAHSVYAILALKVMGDPMLFMPKWAYEGFATGTFVNRNSFATFAAIGAALGATLLVDALSGNGRTGSRQSLTEALLTGAMLYAAGLAIVVTALVLSASRMGFAAAVCGIVVALLVGIPRGTGRPVMYALGVAGLACLGIGAFLLSGGAVLERLGSVEESADVRLLLYEQVLQMIAARPWTGFGGGTFADAFQLYHSLPLSADVTWDSAHSMYLELIADLGIVGLAPMVTIAAICLQSIRHRMKNGPSVVVTAAMAATVVAAVHSIVDFSLRIEANAFVFVALLAAAFSRSWADFHIIGRTLRTEAAPAGKGQVSSGPVHSST